MTESVLHACRLQPIATGRSRPSNSPPPSCDTVIRAVPLTGDISGCQAAQFRVEDDTLLGQMQQHPLLISSLIEHAAHAHADVPIVSCVPGAAAHRCTYADVDFRSRQLAKAL